MKVSEITTKDIAGYIKLAYSDLSSDEKKELDTILAASKSFIKGYTGLNDIEIDKHEDFTIAIFILCQDMYDNGTLYVDKTNVNKVVETILSMYRINLL